MNILPELPLTKLSGTLLVEVGNGLNARMVPLKADSYITRQTGPIAVAATKLMEISGTELASEETPQIKALDDEIDELLRDLIPDLKSDAKKTKFYPLRAESAGEILKIVNRRDLHKLVYGSYDAQGFEIRALLNDVYTPELAGHLEQSETKVVFDLLKKRFDLLTTLRTNRTNETNLPTNTREQRQILRYRIEKLLHFVDSNIFDGVAGFDVVKEPVTQLINEIVAKHKADVTRREAKKAAEETVAQ